MSYEMSEFDKLAERILLANIQKNGIQVGSGNRLQQAANAVELADAFMKQLEERLKKLADTGSLLPEEVSLLRQWRAIDAIKSVRERTGLSMKEAKQLVDKERRRLGVGPLNPEWPDYEGGES